MPWPDCSLTSVYINDFDYFLDHAMRDANATVALTFPTEGMCLQYFMFIAMHVLCLVHPHMFTLQHAFNLASTDVMFSY